MAWCLTKSQENAFRQALIDKKIDPFKLENMSSEQRRSLFENFLDTENASKVNALYESKLLLKNKQAGFKSWAKRSLGMNKVAQRDILSRIERLQVNDVLSPSTMQEFKEDLARARLGLTIGFEEAKHINELAVSVSESKSVYETELELHPEWKVDPQGTRKEWINNSARLEYGLKVVALENYVKELKLAEKSKRVSFKEDPINATLNPIRNAPKFFNDLFKSLMASVDNSLWGRQGIKNLYGSLEQKKIWGRNFKKSFGDIANALINKKVDGFEAIDFIRADIYSRPNALNGKYKAGNYQLGVINEEVFPTSLPERIPVLGRVFSASEVAFSGGALRMRADLADMFISMMDKQGINTRNPSEARGAGHLVGSLTGRGSVEMTPKTQEQLNFLFWSFRFMKANVDTLTAHQFDPQATQFTKQQARKNLVSIIGHVTAILAIAKMLDPDSVDEDPRSTNFGKIKIFGEWVDITGGMASLTRLAARLVPTKRDGEWGAWKKSSTGKWVNLTAGEYGQQDAFDLIVDGVFANKLAPVASIIRDYYRGELFGGEPFNIKKAIINSAIPLSVQSFNDIKDEKFESILAVVVSEFFGMSTYSYKYEAHWDSRDSKEMKLLLEQVGEARFKKANEDFNRAYNIWVSEVEKADKYKALTNESKEDLKTKAKSSIKYKILDEYGYKKEKSIPTKEELKEKNLIKELTP